MDEAVRVLAEVWENFHAEQIYRADSLGVIRTGARWLTLFSMGWLIARWRRARPRSLLLDNAPAADLLQRMVGSTSDQARRCAKAILRALAVTASSYGSGLHVTFYDAVRRSCPGRARSASRCAPTSACRT